MNAFDTPFKHRVNACYDGSFHKNLIDTLNPSLDRAIALADLIETACEPVNEQGFAPDTIWRVAQAIRLEIEDVKTLLYAHIDSLKTKQNEIINDQNSVIPLKKDTP